MGSIVVIGLLLAGSVHTYHLYFGRWTQDTQAYYRSATGVRLAAEYLSQWDPDQVTLFASNDTYRHTTMAAFCDNYERLKWVSGDTLVLPLKSQKPTLYVFDHTNPLDPLLAHYLPAGTLQHREVGPDGEVSFEAYLVSPAQMPSVQPHYSGKGNLGNTLAFLGYDINGPVRSGELLDVTLYWRAHRHNEREDLAFFAHLVDDLGFRWGEESFFHYPSAQWQQGEVIVFHTQIAIAPGAPPGLYTLDIGVFSPSTDTRLPVLNTSGQMAGTAVHAGLIDVLPSHTPPDEMPVVQQPLDVSFGDTLVLQGFDRDRGDLRPGETLALSLYWQAAQDLDTDWRVSIWLEGEAGQIQLWDDGPVHGQYPFSLWRAQQFIRDRYALRLPTDAQAGDYDLRLALLLPDGTPVATREGGKHLSLSTIRVRATDRLWEPPPFSHPVGAKLGDPGGGHPWVELLGYDLDRQEVYPGKSIRLTLVWRCLREMDVSYAVFTHLLDEAEQIRGQQDNPPVGGSYPTTLWVPGEIVVDKYEIDVEDDASPGTHVFEVGMYDPADLNRLSVLEPTGAVGDRVLLGAVRISPGE